MYNLKYLHLTISYILFISILSHISSDGLPDSTNLFSNQDKIFHLVEFFILGILIQLSFLERKFKDKNEIIFLTIIFGFSIACIDELHQSFVPGQTQQVTSSASPFSDDEPRTAIYSDEIPPFDITLYGKNEFGKQMVMRIFDVTIISEGAGISIDDGIQEAHPVTL